MLWFRRNERAAAAAAAGTGARWPTAGGARPERMKAPIRKG